MKKALTTVTFATTLLAATLSGAVFAKGDQEGNDCRGPRDHGPRMDMEHGDRPGPDMRLEFMKKDLNLSDEQVAKIKEIYASHKSEREEIHKQEQALRQKIQSEVQSTLTDEQKAKVEARKEKHEAKLEKRIEMMQKQLDKMKKSDA
ncbi:Spy/CpxP family protein refolding chaperone [Pokkaliibacter sp. CJK22405]|uniref:Spy/CpxP family protein refolding chaperone n=1 Tax=Pokkaliibacter sp. CJK22405 TaxID=3384615 RepID=UPI0039846A88